MRPGTLRPTPPRGQPEATSAMPSSPCFLHFAYGSNMLSRRLRARTPSAVSLGAGRLRGHELRWHKRSADGSGKCDAWVQEGTQAWLHGALYQIAQADKPSLDAAEALGVGDGQKQAVVETAAGPRTALLYVALQIPDACAPRWRERSSSAGQAQFKRSSSAVQAQVRTCAPGPRRVRTGWLSCRPSSRGSGSAWPLRRGPHRSGHPAKSPRCGE